MVFTLLVILCELLTLKDTFTTFTLKKNQSIASTMLVDHYIFPSKPYSVVTKLSLAKILDL